MNPHLLLVSGQPIHPVGILISYVRLDSFQVQVTYQLRRGPVQRHITQYITDDIYKLDPIIGERI